MCRFATWGGDALVLVVPNKAQPPLTPNDHQRFKQWSPNIPPHVLSIGAKLGYGVDRGIPRQVRSQLLPQSLSCAQACMFVGEAGSGKSRALSTLVCLHRV